MATAKFVLIVFCSFVSAIHLAVGVAYCSISWMVGMPKRAVSNIVYCRELHLLKKLDSF